MLVHASAIFVPILAILTNEPLVVGLLVAVSLCYAVSEVLRLRGVNLPGVTKFTMAMSRPQERGGFIARPLYLAIGATLALILFPRNIAYASIAIVAFGDPVAALVGTKLGRTHVGRKSIEGTIAGFLVSAVVASVLVQPIVATIGSAVAMLLELAGWPDDNLTMPVGAGISMMALTLLVSSAFT